MRFLNLQQDFQKRTLKKWGPTVLGFVSELADHLENSKARQLLAFALDQVQSPIQGMGLRITKLSSEGIELLVPQKKRNCDPQGQIDEGLLCSAAVFGFRTLWGFLVKSNDLSIMVKSLQFERTAEFSGDLRLRTELAEVARERLLLALSEGKPAIHDVQFQIFDNESRVQAQLALQVELKKV